MEELNIDFNLEELELIKKLAHMEKFPYPVALVGETAIGFNRYASPIVPKAIKWFCTGEYIIGLPGDKGDRDSFLSHFVDRTRSACKSTAFPADMKAKKVKKGYYKVYKFKNGFAFKRYEPLEVKQ